MRNSQDVQKIEIKKKIEQSSKQTYYVFFICILHILFNTLLDAVKIMTAQSYYFNDKYYHTRLTNLANIQYTFGKSISSRYICFGLLGPFGTLVVQKVFIRIKFRIILFLGALGSCLFLMIPLQTNVCANYLENCTDGDCIRWYCSVPFIFSNAVIFSLISGISQSIYFFTILFYITNITKKEDKSLHFATFFFLHNFCWMLGGGVGFLIMQQENYNYAYYFEICFATSGFLSLIFLATPEGGHDLRLPQFQKQLQIVIKKSLESNSGEENQLKMMLLKNQYDEDSSDEDEDEKDRDKVKKPQSTSENQMTPQGINQPMAKSDSIPLMFFSIENEDLEMVYNRSESAKNHNQKAFLVNLYETLIDLQSCNIMYLVPQILLVSFIQSFTFLYLYYYVNDRINKVSIQVDTSNTLYAFVYLGIGQMFGTFSLGIIGDLSDKLKSIMIFLLLLIVPCIIGLLTYTKFQNIYTNYIFSLILGFCDSGLQVSIISVIIYEFHKHIYIFELIYTIYSIGIAFCSALLIIGNYFQFQISIIILTFFVLINLALIAKYYRLQVTHKRK